MRHGCSLSKTSPYTIASIDAAATRSRWVYKLMSGPSPAQSAPLAAPRQSSFVGRIRESESLQRAWGRGIQSPDQHVLPAKLFAVVGSYHPRSFSGGTEGLSASVSSTDTPTNPDRIGLCPTAHEGVGGSAFVPYCGYTENGAGLASSTPSSSKSDGRWPRAAGMRARPTCALACAPLHPRCPMQKKHFLSGLTTLTCAAQQLASGCPGTGDGSRSARRARTA